MASVKTKPTFVQQLVGGLKERLSTLGIPAKVAAEKIPGLDMYRVYVVAQKFKSMMHSERQDLVWRIAEEALSKRKEDLMRISMILTLEDK
ncbi:MAG: hypothetical protein PHU85_05020 [Phycisphaerae bacterium]|nr:hypothetical protein [Phycisphaerae bacterium]